MKKHGGFCRFPKHAMCIFMTEIRFYHLLTMSLDRALPGLLMQAYKNEMRSVVKFETSERLEAMNDHLWTFAKDSFLPHGSGDKKYAAEQPVWLTTVNENPNNARVIFLVEGAEIENPSDFDLVCRVFDGQNDAAVQNTREQWKTFKDGEFSLRYFKQNENGHWEEKSTENKAS